MKEFPTKTVQQAFDEVDRFIYRAKIVKCVFGGALTILFTIWIVYILYNNYGWFHF